MLSILIPVYNYNVLPLAIELVKQCNSSGIIFEIICLDDASQRFIFENQRINLFENTSYSVLEKNIGQSAIRNLLAKRATYENLLLLDADVIPADSQFVSNYVTAIKEQKKLVFGGQLYKDEKPVNELLLRWIYGRKRESLNVSQRTKKVSDFALVSNLLIKKEILIRFPFDEKLTKYGYEDLLFFTVLKSNNITLSHIDNPVVHLNCETSEVFLRKTQEAIENLEFLHSSHKLSREQSKVIAAYDFLKKLKLILLFYFFYKKSEQKIERNLLSEKPLLFLFDIYKLGYFCSLKIK